MRNLSTEIKNMSTPEEIFDLLIDELEYKDSPNFCKESDESYDARYTISIEGEKYTIIGIKTLKEESEEAITKQHLEYWNSNDVPFSILILSDEIRIYNNFTTGKNKILFSTEQGNADVFIKFTDRNIVNGVLWEQYQKLLASEDRVDKYLLRNLRNTILELYKNHEMKLEDAYSFLAQCIFVKYMEDRGILTETAFIEYETNNFNKLLQKCNPEYIEQFFEKLKKWFNGDLFDLKDVSLLTKSQLEAVRTFFDAEEIYRDGTVQYTLFKYDFSKIPIELISSIYEAFFNLGDDILKNNYSSKNGAYYTPNYLAKFMTDRCFEESRKESSPVILDPACGSGIFLVIAFKRIVHDFRSEGKEISSDELKQIILNNIYGVDINLESLKIACFSLYVALLDFLNPKDIVENGFRFPALIGTTLHHHNFFSDKLDELKIKADIVIGNPPWASDKKGLHNEYCRENKIPISDGQLAQAFIARARDFVCQEGTVSFLVTNSIFTNENAGKFRKHLLSKYQISEIFNLYKVKNSLFAYAKAPCSILTYNCNEESKRVDFDYHSFRPNLIAGAYHKIVYDKADMIKISKRNILEKDYIWRILNNGDDYDVRTVNAIKSHSTIGEQGFECFRGYVVGSKDLKHKPEYLKYRGGNLKEGFQSYLINYNALPQMREDSFERPRELESYIKSNLLVKRTRNKELSGAAFCDEPIIFTDDYYGIWHPDDDELKILGAYINSNVFEYYSFFASKEEVSIKPEMSKGDLLSFPLPEKVNKKNRRKILELVLSIEELLKVKFENVMTDYSINDKIEKHQKEINDIILKTYKLDKVEQATIEYALDYVIPKSDSGQQGTGSNYMEQTRLYSKHIMEYFNNFLDGSGIKFEKPNIISDNLFTLVYFSTEKNDLINIALGNIVDILGLSGIEDINSELLIKKRLTGFTHQGFFIIKEKWEKNWTIMSAIKDADYFAKTILLDEEAWDAE